VLEILVVDDDDHVRKSIGNILTRAGYSVSLAGDGEQAAESVTAHPPDLIIIDVVMPKKGGLETLMALKSEIATPKAIIITGKANTDTRVFRELTDKLGAAEVVKKPFTAKELLETVHAVLAKTA
jgi:DNA-binding response OmpR family regulator